ncbi:hypothetical protein BU24DRAFT_455398 [Aaosphaeria arxii CBS 175.79]|uniref:Arrestin-like N-terminal domain-containing protein n=1 Tax=Aaosphaeria arxii CBS 175.79 TaxID=1450172 RepID=A0A6A5X8V7_9PLEO|nr:uncharacterized protein BU24DRAFT_455398 [Aaosphaeria arxii CBS 175.79]KAF2009392.1 hypothetical protein BU24DRAFT_455398 [Aaosphaeria arxii CBS 175.79]
MVSMSLDIEIKHLESVFTEGDKITGKINLYCAQSTTIQSIRARLVGESTSSLTGMPGLLFSRKEEEKHIFLQQEQKIVPNPKSRKSETRELSKIGAGYHSFDLSLKVPRSAECCSCASNIPQNTLIQIGEDEKPRSPHRLPPSMNNLGKGAEISYRVEVMVTYIRNMFKNTLRKTQPITIWPIDIISSLDRRSMANAGIAKARATVLGPSTGSSRSSVHSQQTMSSSRSHTPAEILMTATFLPDFQLIRPSKRNPNLRGLQLDLCIEKLNQNPHDLYLQSFQMLLVGYTDIRAGPATHGQMTFWTLQSLSNLGIKVFNGEDPEGCRRRISPSLWEGVSVEDSIVPNFSTCNLERRYEVEILMGWQCHSGVDAGRVFFVQVRTPVKVTSGILPGRELSELRVTQITTSHRESSSVLPNVNTGHDWNFQMPPTYDEAVKNFPPNRLSGLNYIER